MSAWPVSSCSSRASRARSSSCASTTRRTASRLDALGQVDRDRGPRRERLGETEVVVGEARVGAALVVGDDDADRLARGRRSGTNSAASGRRAARAHVLVDLGVVEQRVDPLAAAALEHAAALRAGRARVAAPSSLVGLLAVGRLDRSSPSPVGQRDQDDPRVEQLAEPASDEVEQRGELESRQRARRDLVERLELARPARRRLVQPRVLDRDRRLGGEQRRRPPRPPR